MATVLLVRHGETTWNREGKVQGWGGGPLTVEGQDQARAAGAHLADAYDVDRMVASDIQRARETARLVRSGDGGGVDAAVVYDRAWRERDYGDYQGLDQSTVAERDPEYDLGGSLTAVDPLPDGESLAGFRDRVREGWERLLATLGPDETAVVVTHGGPIRSVVADLTGRDFPTLARRWSPENGAITRIEDAHGDPTVAARDEDDHLLG